MSQSRFITIPTSHYCEKARWAMDYVGFAYEEEMHMPVFHMRIAKKAGGKPTVPVLVTGDGVFNDSTDILQFLDRTTEDHKLYPEDPNLRKEVEDFEELCDEVVGKHSRRVIYSYLLQQKESFFQMFPEQCPPHEVRWLRFGFPVFRILVRRAYNINPQSVARSVQKVKDVFALVEARLAQGGDYLFGDTISAADIAFACTAVPIVVPDDYFVKLPSLEDFPAEGRALIEEFRESPAGLYARKLFREDRPRCN
ncbi:MAG: glutathione S-transferase family protein [Planctomycetota bacterium]